ncbi:MAG: hypothetical protein RLY74_65 [Actinomycetota bacterium]|jgi:orotidine-5'-phosphate decarboxylase
MADSPIILALDSTDLNLCRNLIMDTKDYVSIYKLGLEFFNQNGANGVFQLQESVGGFQLFLDLKLHDIPNTIAGASRAISFLKPSFLTVHASGGKEMIKSAVAQLPETAITAVTVLTSLEDESLAEMGLPSAADLVTSLADISVAAGAQAIVTSPMEVAQLRSRYSSKIKLITPGVRPAQVSDDQARTATPRQALAAGADYLVIGRPITGAKDPNQAAAEIFASLR